MRGRLQLESRCEATRGLAFRLGRPRIEVTADVAEARSASAPILDVKSKLRLCRRAPGRSRSANADDGLVVFARAHAGVGKDAVVGDPLEGLVIDLFGIGLEYQPFTRPPAPGVHQGVVALRKFVLVVVCIAIGP